MAEQKNKATLVLEADTKKFTVQLTEAQKSAEKMAQATERSTRRMGKMEKAFRNASTAVATVEGPLGGVAGRLSSIATGLGRVNPLLVATTASITTLGIVMARGLRVFNEEEQAMGRVEGVLQSMGDAATQTGESIEGMSRRIAAATLESTVGVMESAAVLSTFSTIAQRDFERVLMVSADMAATLGGGLVSATKRVARSLEDPIKGMQQLTEAGILFTKTQQEAVRHMVATGDAAEAQEFLLAELEGRYEGVAEKVGGGMAGAFDLLGQRMDEFALKVVKTTGLGEKITSWVTKIAEGFEMTSKLMDPQTAQEIADSIDHISQAIHDGDILNVSGARERITELQKQLTEQIKLEAAAAEELAELDKTSTANRQRIQREAAAAEAAVGIEKFQKLLARTQAQTIQLEAAAAGEDDDQELQEQLKLDRELKRLDERQRAYQADFGIRLEMESEFQRQREALLEGHTLRINQIRKDAEQDMIEYFDEVQELETERQRNKIKDELILLEKKADLHKAVASAVGESAGLLADFMEEGSKAQRVALAVEKAAAISRAIMSTQVAIMRAMETGLTLPDRLAAVATAVSMGASALATIRSVDISGSRALGGPIGRSGNYWVGEHGKELVSLPQGASVASNDDLTQAPQVNISVIEDSSRAGTVTQEEDRTNVFVERFRSTMVDDISKGRGIASAMERQYGLRRRNG